jgi:hypothetical protein
VIAAAVPTVVVATRAIGTLITILPDSGELRAPTASSLVYPILGLRLRGDLARRPPAPEPEPEPA